MTSRRIALGFAPLLVASLMVLGHSALPSSHMTSGIAAGCTKQELVQVKDATVRLADDVCKEEEAAAMADGGTPPPGWVKVACQVESGIVHVLLPAIEWAQIKLATRRAREAFDGGTP